MSLQRTKKMFPRTILLALNYLSIYYTLSSVPTTIQAQFVDQGDHANYCQLILTQDPDGDGLLSQAEVTTYIVKLCEVNDCDKGYHDESEDLQFSQLNFKIQFHFAIATCANPCLSCGDGELRDAVKPSNNNKEKSDILEHNFIDRNRALAAAAAAANYDNDDKNIHDDDGISVLPISENDYLQSIDYRSSSVCSTIGDGDTVVGNNGTDAMLPGEEFAIILGTLNTTEQIEGFCTDIHYVLVDDGLIVYGAFFYLA